MMTGTNNNRLALHNELSMKIFHYLRNYNCDESNSFLPFLLFYIWVFIHLLRYNNTIESWIWWHPVNPYQLYLNSLITRKLSHIRFHVFIPLSSWNYPIYLFPFSFWNLRRNILTAPTNLFWHYLLRLRFVYPYKL